MSAPAVVRLIATSFVLALTASGCVSNGSTGAAVKQPALPAAARIVRTAELSFPPGAMPSSKKPNASQQAVVFLDANIGFLARGGQPFGSDTGGTYLPEPGGIERSSDGRENRTSPRGVGG